MDERGIARHRVPGKRHIERTVVLAKLTQRFYYLRNLTGKATRIREKKVRVAVPETGSTTE